MANTVEIILKAIDLASKEINKTKKSVGDLGDVTKELGLNLPTTLMAGFGAAVVGVSAFVVSSVKNVAAYNKTIGLLADNLSMTTEETSRVIQVADDFGIEMSSVETAMKFAVKNGFVPSIENLAQLADHLKTVQDPTVRAAELVKIFGRNWSELTPLLNAGGDAIRNGSAAIADGLIVTNEARQASREYAIALDGLTDSWTAFANQVGNSAIPTIVKALGTTQVLVNLQKLENDLKLTTIERLILEIRYQGNQAGAVEELTNKLFLQNQAIKHETFLRENNTRWIKDDIVLTKELTDETQDATNAAYEMNRVNDVSADRWQALGASILGTNGAIDEAISVFKSVSDVTAEYSTQLLFAKAAEGMTAEQALILARGLGLVDEAMVTAITMLAKLKQSFDSGAMSAAAYAYQVAQLDLYIKGLKDKTVKVTTVFDTIAPPPPSSGGRAAGGPVSAGHGYVVGEAGPEYFVPNQSGNIVPNNKLGAAGGGINLTINAYGLDENALAQAVVMRLNSMARVNRASGRAYAGRG